MSRKHINALLVLAVIVPLLSATCILVVFVMVLPNSSSGGPFDTGTDDDLGAHSDKNPNHHGQVSTPSNQNNSHLLFILGIVFASGLFVFLIVIVVVVCVWARKAQGYVIGGSSGVVTGKDDCHLTKHSHHKHIFSNKIQEESHSIKWLNEDRKNNSTLVASIPNPPVTTVPVTAQFPGKNISEGGINSDPYQIINGAGDQVNIEVARPQNYGTLSRTHLLSSVDEDGYHFDSLGIDNNAINKEDFCPSFDEVAAPIEKPSDDLEVYDRESGESSPKPSSFKDSYFAEGESATQDKPLEKQLSKQDSFQGLPPFKSFDKYLTLVRLDSTTSLESYSLEDIKKSWRSIEEEDEREKTVVTEKEN